MNDPKHEKFRDLLEQNYQWPDFYTWKFIVKTDGQGKVISLLQGMEIRVRESGKGNYVSITVRKFVSSTDEVLAVYQLIAGIPGVLSL